MASIYDSNKEQKLHGAAIHSIAQQYHMSENTVKELYEQELLKLKPKAHVKNFLSVLTVRHVKDSIHRAGITTTDY